MTARPPLCCLTAAALIALLACGKSGEGVIALEGATLIDGVGGAPKEDALILVRNGHIEAVARVNEIPIPKGAERINLVGKTIIPGLIDAHAHVERWAAPRYLAWGVTTVRDLHSDTDSGIKFKNDLNLGSIIGPRMFTSGAMIDATPATYPNATGVANASEARHTADQRRLAGADYIKVYTRITPTLLRAIADEARGLQLPIAAHLGKTDALTAARMGVVSLEHMAGVVQAASRNPAVYYRAHDRFLSGWTTEEKGWAALDSASLARTARALAQTKVVIVPTLVVHEMLSRLDNPVLLTRPGMEDVPDDAESVRSVASLLRRTGWKPRDFQAFRRSRARQDLFVREFKRAGGVVAAGTDAANQLLIPGFSEHEEMALLVDAGLTPLEAITAATRRGAQVLKADSLGIVAPGNVADLVVLNANPARDIAATHNIAWVMTRGRVVWPDSLRSAWKK